MGLGKLTLCPQSGCVTAIDQDFCSAPSISEQVACILDTSYEPSLLIYFRLTDLNVLVYYLVISFISFESFLDYIL